MIPRAVRRATTTEEWGAPLSEYDDETAVAFVRLAEERDAEQLNGVVEGEPADGPVEEAAPRRPLALGIDAFLSEPEPEYDWVVPNLLERGDRLILTGGEGDGKSTLLRQMTIQLGAGIHPFTLEPMDPARVLYVDLENSRRHVRREFRPLRLAVKDHGVSVSVAVVAQGIDLLQFEDRELLEAQIVEAEPEVLVAGPLYKLASGDPTEEKVARTVALVLDHLRTKYGFALVLEAHTPHPINGKVVERPYGARLWMRWPEFGLFLGKGGELRHWRGDRDTREWPVILKRGGEWPWMPADSRDVTFAQIKEAVREAGRKLSLREFANHTGGAKSTIERAIKANQKEFDLVCARVEREGEIEAEEF